MKRQSILFLAGGLLALASCNSNNENAGMSQAQIDSMVNVKVQEMTVQMQASNDSMINALAQAKADSMIAAMKGASASSSSHSTHHTTTTKPTETAPPPPPPPPARDVRPGATNQKGQNTPEGSGSRSVRPGRK
jgi:hypothetical protein